MYLYQAPHRMRAIAEAFERGEDRTGYMMMSENQVAMDRRATMSSQYYTLDDITVTEGSEVTLPFAVVGGIWNVVRATMFSTATSLTGATYTFDPLPDDGFFYASTVVWQGSPNMAVWDTTQTVNFTLQSGWTRASGTGDVTFTRFAITHGLTLESEV